MIKQHNKKYFNDTLENIKKSMKKENNRRNRLDLNTPAEIAIFNAMQEKQIKKENKPVTDLTFKRDIAVIYESFIRYNNLKGEELNLLHQFYSKVYNGINFPEHIEKEEQSKTTIEFIREAFEPIQLGEKIEDIPAFTIAKCLVEFPAFDKTRLNKRFNAYDFVVKYKTLIYQNIRHYNNYTEGKNDKQLQELIELARKEIGYSNKTWSGDIFTSLVNLYKKICV